MMLYAQRQYSSLTVGEIAERYGKSPSSVSMSVKAIRQGFQTDQRLAANLERLEERLADKSEK